MKRQTLWIREPGLAEVREDSVPRPESDEMLVRTEISAVSAGTERLFFKGRVPEGSEVDPHLPALNGRLQYPLKYGYSSVGTVETVGSDVERTWLGRRVFAFRPHESHFTCKPDDVLVLPDQLHARDGVFLANLETAVNFLLDGAPLVGEKVVVHGQGVVGLLTTALLAELPLRQLIALEPAPNRRQVSLEMGADACLDPSRGGVAEELREMLDEPGAKGADLSYELSGAPAALDLALGTTGYSGRIVVGAWYGEEPISLQLGQRFHRSRLSVISSQVSSLNPGHRGRWSTDRRLQTAVSAAQRLRPSRLITHELPIDSAEKAYELLDRPDETIQIVITYGPGR